MSKSEVSGHVRVKEKIPYAGKGADELARMVRLILADHPYAQKIVLEVGKPYIRIEDMVPEAEAPTAQISLHDVIRTSPMEEITPEPEKSGIQTLWAMFTMVQEEGFEAGFIAIGDKKKFQDWLGIRIPVTKMSFFGVPVRQVKEIPQDVVLVCGTHDRDAEHGDVKFSVKVSIP